MIIDCLRYWAEEYHVDGFRFDLASILSRDENGAPLANPPLLESLAYDPILAKCKLVAEAWDAGGLYQVGSFPAHGRWAEWNGKYRDGVRKFLKGEEGRVGDVAQRVQGSPDLYSWGGRGPTASINFITAHDGFTLYDLFSYNGKHNEANGENNNDGGNDNDSWNCGWEGPTDDPNINQLRLRQVKNAISILLTSQGIPMFVMGDEIGRSQSGNNNTYCQDNALNWLNWESGPKESELLRYFQQIMAFRHAHPILRHNYHFSGQDWKNTGYPDISWHGGIAWSPDWSADSRSIAFMLNGAYAKNGGEDSFIYVALNSHWESKSFGLPQLPDGRSWHVFANTGANAPQDIWELGKEPRLDEQSYFMMGARSVAILVGKQAVL
jgi:glycogen operon protein